ncbi:protein shisa-5 isoform X2 [Gallus gallus]|uniref:protein shisa-5 isoform X2 n=1 Tax=Gallus gallus TaxID=9031 RepID=UPI001F02FC06|nr:protein shisa-5 isoform X2 [Gallus gallus]
MTPREQPRAHPHVLPPGPRGHHNWEAGRSHTPFSVSPFSAFPKRGSVRGWDHGAAFPPGLGGTFPRPWPRRLTVGLPSSNPNPQNVINLSLSLLTFGSSRHTTTPFSEGRSSRAGCRDGPALRGAGRRRDAAGVGRACGDEHGESANLPAERDTSRAL